MIPASGSFGESDTGQCDRGLVIETSNEAEGQMLASRDLF